MNDSYKFGSKVRMKTVLGTVQPPADVRKEENYWTLIGCTGTITSEERRTNPAYPEMGASVLVTFDEDVLSYGLYCHNEAPNALWIFETDLEVK